MFQIIDIYDALTSERPYKKAFSPIEALEIIAEETARGWRNPKLVQQFSEFIRFVKVGESSAKKVRTRELEEKRLVPASGWVKAAHLKT